MLEELKTKLNEKERIHRFQDVEIFTFRRKMDKYLRLFCFGILGVGIGITFIISIIIRIELPQQYIADFLLVLLPFALGGFITVFLMMLGNIYFWKHPIFIELDYTEKKIEDK